MKIDLNKKVQGGAIYYAVFIGFVMCLVAVLFLFTAKVHNQYADYYIMQDRLKDNVASALRRLLTEPSLVSYNSESLLDVFGDGEDSVKVTKTYRGAYRLLHITASWRNISEEKYYLTGTDFEKGEPIALYLPEKNNYLSVSGSTQIRGNAYLPKLGIRETNIEGSGFTPDKLLDGEKKRSSRALPLPDSVFTTYLDRMINGRFGEGEETVLYETALQKGQLYNPFSNKALCLYSGNNILVDNGLRLSGNIIIYSPKQIVIQGGAMLEDILFFAPSIIIKEGFKGSIQVFAADSLVLEKGVRLLYPSYAGLYNTALNNCTVSIGHGAKVEGGLFVYQKGKAAKEPYLLLDEGSKVAGQVYCTGNIEMKGQVKGCVYANGFYLKTPSAFYENHLLNATIDIKSLPTLFAGLDASREKEKLKLVQCLE